MSTTATDGLAGQVAVVSGGDAGLGREVALALAARGVRVVVTGGNEKALAETVGEIASGGGKARHLVRDTKDVAHLRVAASKATETFGAVGIVVLTAPGVPADTIAASWATAGLNGPWMLIHVHSDDDGGGKDEEGGDGGERETERLVRLVLLLCSAGKSPIGLAISVGPMPPFARAALRA
jgi:NAD(P)-dependent dehydrogenase (short-subunit alcohol dehydrogenase family)